MTTSDDPVPDADDERTDPESPTGLRRSLAAQSRDTESWRQIAHHAHDQLAEANAAAAAAGIKCTQLRHRLALSIALNVALAAVAVLLVVALLVVLR